MSAEAAEPAKVILLGEHFVVHGSRAVSLAIDRLARARVRRSRSTSVRLRFVDADGSVREARPGPESHLYRYVEEVGRRLSIGPLDVEVAVDFPISAGLGSSASMAAALARAAYRLARGREPARDEVYALANLMEEMVHGRPSGIDLNTVLEKAVILYDGGARRVVDRVVGPELWLVVADTGERRVTGRVVSFVGRVKREMGGVFTGLLEAVDAMSVEGFAAVRRGDLRTVGLLMSANHGILYSIGVSTHLIERLVVKLSGMGAYGAKLTGAGGGGCVIALFGDGESAEEAAETLVSEGLQAFAVRPLYA
ncbi:mevalonate kinase [Candidatus Geothermarchaeota archaeon ex4572_27]|nr:MAG: mevalonate kinase [Candidatus Geothermarchaeota archaeon ex4572_27]